MPWFDSGVDFSGLVKTSFANPYYRGVVCETPVTALIDPDYSGDGCLSLRDAGTAFYNYQAYLRQWSELVKSGNGTDDLRTRPNVYAMLNDNTTVNGSWIQGEHNDMAELYQTYGHVIVNISMAMPHVGVIDAALDPMNRIVQPTDLGGRGNYRIRASVPSPVVYVTCAMLSKDDLRPIVVDLANHTLPPDMNVPTLNTSDVYRGGTSLDAIFQWGESYGSHYGNLFRWPPVFPRLPSAYNTILNDTLGIPHGRDSVYILGNSSVRAKPLEQMLDPSTDNFIYPLCQVKVGLTPHCSTWYDASPNYATLTAHCEDTSDSMAYIKSRPNATSGIDILSIDWPSIGGDVFRSAYRPPGLVELTWLIVIQFRPSTGGWHRKRKWFQCASLVHFRTNNA